MRRWVFDREAEADLQAQLDYLIEQGAVDAAERLAGRIKSFLRDFLTTYPATGAFLNHRNLGRPGFPAPDWCCGTGSLTPKFRSLAFGMYPKTVEMRAFERRSAHKVYFGPGPIGR